MALGMGGVEWSPQFGPTDFHTSACVRKHRKLHVGYMYRYMYMYIHKYKLYKLHALKLIRLCIHTSYTCVTYSNYIHVHVPVPVNGIYIVICTVYIYMLHCLVCLFDLACFFLSFFSSLINRYMYTLAYNYPYTVRVHVPLEVEGMLSNVDHSPE